MRILIDNALRFAPSGSAVRVGVSTGTFTVTDDGAGIPADEHEIIFERFARGHNAGPGAGFGLGLAIGRELMRRMDGDLQLDSGTPIGARFRATVPAAQPWATDGSVDRQVDDPGESVRLR